jgi:hypothetical protein
VAEADLAQVQRRREFPTRVTQRFQVLFQNNVIDPVLRGDRDPSPPVAIRIAARFNLFQRMFGRLVAVGVRPEHVRTRDAFAPS